MMAEHPIFGTCSIADTRITQGGNLVFVVKCQDGRTRTVLQSYFL